MEWSVCVVWCDVCESEGEWSGVEWSRVEWIERNGGGWRGVSGVE